MSVLVRYHTKNFSVHGFACIFIEHVFSSAQFSGKQDFGLKTDAALVGDLLIVMSVAGVI